MATFRFHTTVRPTPDEVWSVLSDVDTIPQWFPGVVSARYEDGFRVLTLADGGRLRARVVTSDPVLRRFQYSFVEGMPVPIAFHLGTLDVIPLPPAGDPGAPHAGSMVVYSQHIEPDELGRIVGPAVAGGIEGIARYFSTA